MFSFYYLQGIDTNHINNTLKASGHLDIFYCENAKTVNSTCFITHNTTDLKIVSPNVRGLGNNAKRKRVFNWLKAKNQSIYICCKRSIVLKTLPIYGLVSGGTKRSSAAAAATNFQIHKVFSDPNGWFLICDIVADSKRLTVANIYNVRSEWRRSKLLSGFFRSFIKL